MPELLHARGNWKAACALRWGRRLQCDESTAKQLPCRPACRGGKSEPFEPTTQVAFCVSRAHRVGVPRRSKIKRQCLCPVCLILVLWLDCSRKKAHRHNLPPRKH